MISQVYPRSFADTGVDGVGDLQGLTARLHHLARLGADATFGLSAVTEVLVGIDRPLGIVGGAVHLLAARAFREALPRTSGAVEAPADGGGHGGSVGARASMVGLTLTNPATLMLFAALLTGITARLRARLTPSVTRILNLASAAVIAAS